MKIQIFNRASSGGSWKAIARPLLLSLLLSHASAADGDGEIARVPARPDSNDGASERLLDNYLTASGGNQAHLALENVVALGTLEEAGKSKKFELIETRDGKRHLTLSWRWLGRDYREIFVFDGRSAWRQEIAPGYEDPEEETGLDGLHFANQRWLLQPFVAPLRADFAFKYQGTARVRGRPCHVVVGFGRNDERSWFYFDREKFLLIRWGGYGGFAGVKEHKDYRATEFRRVDGILLPGRIDLIVDDNAYGEIRFDSILTNQRIDPGVFQKPPDQTPVLRQRTVERNNPGL